MLVLFIYKLDISEKESKCDKINWLAVGRSLLPKMGIEHGVNLVLTQSV
ncbi:hypothetical protein [Cylindrospermopsis raciborskii]|nr:hypothetical protein [Cylindrospermopsis raciborskii]